MSSRIPLQPISTNTSDYSLSTMYEPYCHCCYYENQSMCMENSYAMNYNSVPISISSTETNDSKKKTTIRRSKHIPHHLRPQHIVERRNRRERLRVQDVNQAFYMLQQLLPLDSNSEVTNHIEQHCNSTQNSSRLSKVQTLRKAADYIHALQQMLNENN